MATCSTAGGSILGDDTFRDMARAYPAVSPLRELRSSLSGMRLSDLAVGRDGRNRTILSAFGARTGATSRATRSSFSAERLATWIDRTATRLWHCLHRLGATGVWHRGRVVPRSRMQAAYLSGDPYLAFAKQAGAAPADATKLRTRRCGTSSSRPSWRCNTVWAPRRWRSVSDSRPFRARELLRLHRETYPVLGLVRHRGRSRHAYRKPYTVFGWRVRVPAVPNARSLRNFPMQANGAEMLRLAVAWRPSAASKSVRPSMMRY